MATGTLNPGGYLWAEQGAQFDWTDEIVNANYTVKPGETYRFMSLDPSGKKQSPAYQVVSHPPVRTPIG